MWRTELHRAGALSARLDLSCLSRVSDSYTIGKYLENLFYSSVGLDNLLVYLKTITLIRNKI